MGWNVLQGSSSLQDPDEAVKEIISKWQKTNETPDIIFCYCSSQYDTQVIASKVSKNFPKSKIVGCTTSGEFSGQGHRTGTLVLTAIHSPTIKWQPVLLQNIKSLKMEEIRPLIQTGLKNLGADMDSLDTSKYFSLLMIDGLSLSEERISDYLADALEGIPLLGGSAGDDLKFKETKIIFDGQAYTNAAVVVIGKSEVPYDIFKHQHFTTSEKDFVITKADSSTRTVYELNGLVAADVYAGALGLDRSQLTGEVTFLNPVQITCDGKEFVRSIQKLNDDGSITFYCAIQEGMVINMASHKPMTKSLQEDLAKFQKKKKAELLLGFNCILRRLEAENRKCDSELSEEYRKVANITAGFDTYGEQLQGLHINQTLVGILLYAA